MEGSFKREKGGERVRRRESERKEREFASLLESGEF